MAENDDWWKDDTEGSHDDNGFGTRSTQNDAKDFNPRSAQYDRNPFAGRPVSEGKEPKTR